MVSVIPLAAVPELDGFLPVAELVLWPGPSPPSSSPQPPASHEPSTNPTAIVHRSIAHLDRARARSSRIRTRTIPPTYACRQRTPTFGLSPQPPPTTVCPTAEPSPSSARVVRAVALHYAWPTAC